MKTVFVIARVLLGIVFTVFGLNGFLHFIPMGPLPSGPAGQYLMAVTQSHYMAPIFLLQLISGILLLANQFVPLAVMVLAGILTNILLFHITMEPAGLPLALFTLLLWIIVFVSVGKNLSGIFIRKSTI